MRQVKWMLFQLLFISAFILPYICWTDEENKGVSGSDLPRCDQFQEIDEAYFDRLEFVGRHLLDSLQRIHDFERLQQKLNMRKSKQNKIKSAQYFDYRAYLKRQEKMLKEIDLLLLEKRQEVNRFADPTVFVTNKQRVQDESKKFADPAILEKGTGGNTNALQVIVSSTETKAGTVLTNDVPRCAQTQEVDSDFFEKLEDVETQICDALLSIHSCDVVHQRKKMPPRLISKGYIDMQLYLKKRQELLELLKAEAEDKIIVKKTFLDPPVKTINKHESSMGDQTKEQPQNQSR